MIFMGTDIAIILISTAFLFSLTIGIKVAAKIRETAKEKPQILSFKERLSNTLQKTECDPAQECKLQTVANNVSQKIRLKKTMTFI